MPASLLTLCVNGTVSGHQIRKADTWWRRAVGLLATPELKHHCGLWLKPCNGVHTFWMRYPIDVVFLGHDGAVLKVVSRLRPWRLAACRGATSTVELRAGLAEVLGIAPGGSLHLMA